MCWGFVGLVTVDFVGLVTSGGMQDTSIFNKGGSSYAWPWLCARQAYNLLAC